jgi:hypothetical protein
MVAEHDDDRRVWARAEMVDESPDGAIRHALGIDVLLHLGARRASGASVTSRSDAAYVPVLYGECVDDGKANTNAGVRP